MRLQLTHRMLDFDYPYQNRSCPKGMEQETVLSLFRSKARSPDTSSLIFLSSHRLVTRVSTLLVFLLRRVRRNDCHLGRDASPAFLEGPPCSCGCASIGMMVPYVQKTGISWLVLKTVRLSSSSFILPVMEEIIPNAVWGTTHSQKHYERPIQCFGNRCHQ